jgi:hypothetical protein
MQTLVEDFLQYLRHERGQPAVKTQGTHRPGQVEKPSLAENRS